MSPEEPEKVRIVGIYLVKNEEVFLEQVVVNTYAFCDKLIIVDNFSTDSTYDIANRLAEKSTKIVVHRVKDPSESHEFIRPFCSTKTWIFAVDGDEIYDPKGLALFKEKLLDGAYDDWWVLFGNVLNCTQINFETFQAKGYLAPPCRSVTKLYNFYAINDWTDCEAERLHGGNIHFKKNWNATLRLDLYKNMQWEQAVYRCLHLCFLSRSSKDKSGTLGVTIRENISDLRVAGLKKMIEKIANSCLNRRMKSDWKLEKYMRGELVQKDVADFFSLRFQDLHNTK
jgi:glycosyltransferase involved in cell wall biosynthesis